MIEIVSFGLQYLKVKNIDWTSSFKIIFKLENQTRAKWSNVVFISVWEAV